MFSNGIIAKFTSYIHYQMQVSRYSFIFICVHVCAHVFVCMCDTMLLCMWRPEVDVGCLFNRSPLVLWDTVSHLAWSSLTNWRAPVSSGDSVVSASPALELQAWLQCIALCGGAADLDLDSLLALKTLYWLSNLPSPKRAPPTPRELFNWKKKTHKKA